MKRMTYFMMALALMLGLTQCKKESIKPQNVNVGVRITLNVENSGNRHDVNTVSGEVNYQDGDVIYVGDGSHFIGTLTRENGTFSGTINPEPADGAQIHFYFLGGLTPSVTPEAGSTSDFTVNISDQTSKLSVLSYEHVTYYENTTSYSCELKNKCGLVRFPLENAAGSVKVSGMHTEATISFNGTPGINPTNTTGQVSLYSVSNTEKWAILLPQGRVTDAYLQGVQVDVPQVTDNIRIVSIPTIGNPATMINLDEITNSYTTAQDGAIIYGELSGHWKNLYIAEGATVTLRNATINDEGWWDEGSAGITCKGDATIILEGGNVVRGYANNYPGIQINGGRTLTIMGDGSLTVSPRNTDSRAAGIGAGNFPGDCGNIVITGGSIYATGGKGAAAIGGCEGYSCGYITITDGVTRVEATKGGDGDWGGSPLSIGKGADSDTGCGTVTIGGTVYWDGSDYQNDGYAYLSQSPLIYPSSTPTPDPTPTPPTEGVGSLIYDNDNYPIAMVAYVGEDYTLAIRLYDWVTMSDPESESITNFTWNDAKSMIQSYNEFTGEAWRLPTVEEWTKMFVACGCSFDEWSGWNCDELMTKLNVAGGEPLYKDLDNDYIDFYYWTGTEGDYPSSAKAVDFHKSDGHKIASFVNQDTWNEYLVRPIIQMEAQHQ